MKSGAGMGEPGSEAGMGAWLLGLGPGWVGGPPGACGEPSLSLLFVCRSPPAPALDLIDPPPTPPPLVETRSTHELGIAAA